MTDPDSFKQLMRHHARELGVPVSEETFNRVLQVFAARRQAMARHRALPKTGMRPVAPSGLKDPGLRYGTACLLGCPYPHSPP